jgi:hypothetical protein
VRVFDQRQAFLEYAPRDGTVADTHIMVIINVKKIEMSDVGCCKVTRSVQRSQLAVLPSVTPDPRPLPTVRVAVTADRERRVSAPR